MSEETPSLSVGVVSIFYGAMTLVALGIAHYLELDVWSWHDRNETSQWFDLALGATFGLIVVGISAALTPRVKWMQELSASFREMLGSKSIGEVAIFALASGFGEEILFRGLIQQVLSTASWAGESPLIGWIVASILFGSLHIGPDRRKFMPWTISALVLGFAIGGIYWFTGNLIAPIMAHFTINFFNLQLICGAEVHVD